MDCAGLEGMVRILLNFLLPGLGTYWLAAESMILLSEKGKEHVLLNAGATSKYNSVHSYPGL